MKHLFTCLFLLGFLPGKGISQNLDSLEAAALKLPDDTAKIGRLLALSRKFSQSDSRRETGILLKGRALAERLNARDWLPKMDYAIGRVHANSGRLDSALQCWALAERGFEQQGNLKELAKVCANMPYVHKRLGNYEKAGEYAFKAVGIYEKLGDQKGLGVAYSKIGSLLYAQKKYPDAVKYTQKSLDLGRAANDSAQVAYCLQLLGDIALQSGENEKALALQNECLAICKRLGDSINIANSLMSIGNSLQNLKRYPEALAAGEEALRVSRSIGYQEAASLHNIAICHLLMGDFRKAVSFGLETKRAIAGDGNRFLDSQTDLRLAEGYAGLGKFDSAYFFKKRGEAVGDSLLNSENSLRMSELQTKYETAQKEATIAGQQGEIARQRNGLWLVGGTLALVALIGGLLFRLTRILRKRNAEKEFLIKEIHHRVKNNLQVLSSLLHLQSRQIKDEAALGAVREGQNRVDAMGLIHQKLYMGDRLAAVEMGEYLHELGDTLLDSFGLHDGRVKIDYRLDPLRLDVDTAIPLGLIINELVTNSLKYAFPGGRAGTVEISLWKDETGKLCLKVADDGVGKAGVLEKEKSTSFGTGLVEMLSKKLRGRPEVEAGGAGYATVIRFENFKMA